MSGPFEKTVLSRFIELLQKQVFIAVVLIVAAVAFRYYVLSTDEHLEAKASNESLRGGVKRAPNKTEAPAPSKPEPVMPVAVATAQESRPAPGAVKGDAVKISAPETALEHAKKHLDPTYVCPMHPQITSRDPNATCPICGMKLVAVEAGAPSFAPSNATEAETVTVAQGVINMLGVRTEQVKRRTLYRRIDTVANVSADENRVRTVSLRTDGWIEKLMVKAAGTRVRKGDILFEVYSPKLVNAQEEFVRALDDDNTDLIPASRDRLRALGIAEEQIGTLERTRKAEQYVKIHSKQDGIVSELTVREGYYVEPSAPILSLTDLSSIWLVANVFERQAGWVNVGDRAEAVLPFNPEKQWEGEVEYVYPSLDPKTRSLMVRLRFDNPGEALKPNMYADVHIFSAPKKEVISVPREAVIRTGEGDRVILALGEGRFRPVRVRAGIETAERVEILSGVQEGERVVVSSQFLIDSESSLRAALLRMSPN